jgi:hypothetical protein
MAEASWWRFKIVRYAPPDWPAAEYEGPFRWWTQRKPLQAWKPPNLEVVRLNVRAFQKVVTICWIWNPT